METVVTHASEPLSAIKLLPPSTALLMLHNQCKKENTKSGDMTGRLSLLSAT